MSAARCKGKTKRGTKCKAPPLKGTSFCLAHSPAKVRESAGFVADNGKAGRKPLPKPTDLARRLVEENVAAIFRPHFKALGLQINDDLTVERLEHGAIVVHQGEATEIEDLGAQITAARELLDRVYGRPKQSTEITGADGGPLQTQELIPSDADWHTQVAHVLDEAEAIKGSANGAGPDPA